MYKSRLQEVCQRRGWGLPEYTTSRTGPDHMTRFTATVKIKGDLVFETPNQCSSSKEAQNTAAHMAFDHINTNPIINNPVPIGAYLVAPLPTSLPTPSPGLVTTVKNGDNGTLSGNTETSSVQPEAECLRMSIGSQDKASKGLVTIVKNGDNVTSSGKAETPQTGQDTTGVQPDSACFRMSIGSQDKASKDSLHMYKNRLQQYGQKNNLGFPVYTAESEGPPHNRRFKSRVSLDGKSYETLEFFTTLKEAEQAAAKVACQMLSVDAIQEDGSLYKNLLQELAQKMNLPCPSYETPSCGMSHRPVFVSEVEVGSETFRGGEAFTKKQAEMNAAKVGYLALTERCQAKESSSIASVAVNDNLTQTNQSSEVVKQRRPDASYEESQAHAKKLRSGDGIVNIHSPGPSNGDLLRDDPHLHFSSPSENSTALPLESIEQPVIVEGQTSPQVKTVVFPRKLNLPVPENATIMPYSDERFVAYKAGLPEPSA